MTRLSAALVCLAALSTPAAAGGFRIEGKDVKTAKLVFDSKGIDRSSAEGTARGLLEVYASIRSKTLETQFESLALAEQKRILKPLLTSESYNDLLGKKEEQLRDAMQLMAKIALTTDIKITDTTIKDGVTTLRYLLVMKMRVPCKKCFRAEKGDPACSRCKGTGVKERDRKTNGAVQVKQKGKLWLVKALKQECYRCKGGGKAPAGRAPAVPPHKCSGAGCATCPAPAPAGDCDTCQGTGLREDRFFRGPDTFEGLPTLDTTKPDLSSPEKAFAAFSVALQARRVSQKALETQLGKGFASFVTYFCHPDHMPAPRTRKVNLTDYKLLEVHKDGDDVARINYATAGPSAPPAAATKVAGKVELRRGGDGNWRVSQVMTPCWSCSYRRKSDPNFQCKRCNNTGFRKATYLP